MTSRNYSAAQRYVDNVLPGYGDIAGLEATPPVIMTRGQGIFVYDEAGKEYIEGAAGMWCAAFGFNEQALIDAAVEQLHKLPYYINLTDKATTPTGELAERLKAIAPAPMARVFFANSGSEANDTMVKLVWYYNNAIGRPKKKKIIGRRMGFHGLTIGAGSLTGIPAMHTAFDLPIANVLHTDFPHYYREALPGESEEAFATRLAINLDALIEQEGPETVAAFVAEPVMGAAGAIVPPATYFEKIQAVLKKHDVLFMADEVITGYGRTGKMFGCETFGIKPDLMSLAKGITSSYQPLSAVLVGEKLWEPIAEQAKKVGIFAHAFTTTGHPVAVAVALKVLDLFQERDMLNHIGRLTPILQNGLRAFADHPLVGQVRGVGLCGAVELVADKASKRSFAPQLRVKEFVRRAAQARGLILRATASGDSIAFSPPLIINEAQLAEIMRRFRATLDETHAWVESNNLRAVKAG
ncbi:MAG: aminotransferase class III-fold pyridoxal phosphate-dependent enzyme [Alphaproteobacteria bacterium]|nr:aminotransferase class III-fold pyridoxal phosphate-dependent enzyme [Alphaproteobacteria bacterium]